MCSWGHWLSSNITFIVRQLSTYSSTLPCDSFYCHWHCLTLSLWHLSFPSSDEHYVTCRRCIIRVQLPDSCLRKRLPIGETWRLVLALQNVIYSYCAVERPSLDLLMTCSQWSDRETWRFCWSYYFRNCQSFLPGPLFDFGPVGDTITDIDVLCLILGKGRKLRSITGGWEYCTWEKTLDKVWKEQHHFCNPILFAICTSAFSILCKSLYNCM
jgi:hypothetical protein